MNSLPFQKEFIHFLLKNEYNKSTIQAYEYGLKNFCVFLNKNNLTINDLNKFNLDNYIKFLLENKSKSSVNIKLSCLKKYYEFLNKYKKIALYVDSNRIKQIKIDKKEKNNMDFNQIDSVLAKIGKKQDIISKRDYIIFQLV
ncbi:site-specific integrase, partial [Patescibacteria group bacterium]